MREIVQKLLSTKISKCVPIARNSVAEVFNCDDRFAVKHSQKSDLLEIEAKMLRYLAEYSDMPVPGVIYLDKHFLITEYIPNDGSCNTSCEKEIARKLAALHSVSADKYGFSYDTTIGPFIQPNSWRKSWVKFYKEMRVEVFAHGAYEEGMLPKQLYERVLRLADELHHYLIEPRRPSLIHGDIWSGNLLTRSNSLSALIDPAIYYASYEVELAFIAMFHTLGETFYKEYDAVSPIDEGFFEERMKLYQIYPLLVHVRAFGGGYLRSLERILEEYDH